MILIARIGSGIELVLDDEELGTLTYTPEHIEELARRLGRQAVKMYVDIPAQHVVTGEGE